MYNFFSLQNKSMDMQLVYPFRLNRRNSERQRWRVGNFHQGVVIVEKHKGIGELISNCCQSFMSLSLSTKFHFIFINNECLCSYVMSFFFFKQYICIFNEIYAYERRLGWEFSFLLLEIFYLFFGEGKVKVIYAGEMDILLTLS